MKETVWFMINLLPEYVLNRENHWHQGQQLLTNNPQRCKSTGKGFIHMIAKLEVNPNQE